MKTMMTQVQREKVERMKVALHEQCKTTAQKASVTEWCQEVSNCLEKMDPHEYGNNMLHNVEKFARRLGGKKIPICNRVVENTQMMLMAKIAVIMARKMDDALEMIPDVGTDHLLEDGKYKYRGYKFFIIENKHSFTVQFVVEKNSDELEDVMDVVKEVVR